MRTMILTKRKRRKRGYLLARQCSVPITTYSSQPICEYHPINKQSRILKTKPFDCDSSIQLRLAGLNGGLNFQLFRNLGRRVKVTIEQGSTTRVIAGIICNMGTNFVDIKQKADKVVTILQERIINIEWLDRYQGPCTHSGQNEFEYANFEEIEEE